MLNWCILQEKSTQDCNEKIHKLASQIYLVVFDNAWVILKLSPVKFNIWWITRSTSAAVNLESAKIRFH